MLIESINPELSPGASFSHLLVVIPLAIAVLLPIAALFSIWRWRLHMEVTHVLIWDAIVIFAPFIGSIVWFAAGKRLHSEPEVPASSSPPR